MAKNLTIIIPVLNDRIQLIETINSIKRTNPGCEQPKILVVDDCSDDGLCESDVLKFSNTFYIRNNRRLGTGMSRHIGVKNCNTDYFLFIDSHMRFKTYGWASKVESLVRANKNCFINLTCLVLFENRLDLHSASKGYGATINLIYTESNGIIKYLEAKWLTNKRDRDIYEIPCLMGAGYASSVEWFNNIRGFDGTYGWGADEQWLSLKTWLLGGKVLHAEDIEVGHIFKTRPPYTIEPWTELYNKMVLMKILLPESYYNFVVKNMAISNINKRVLTEINNNSSLNLKRQFFHDKIKLNFKDYCDKFNIEWYE